METDGGVERARQKKVEKNCDLMILNNVLEDGAGFAVDTNIVTIIDENGETTSLPKLSKLEVANRILDRARALLPTGDRSGR
jgi:phosphopantothenoylcysteine decarboxylase/phosphopantothenate--cysteine ligase